MPYLLNSDNGGVVFVTDSMLVGKLEPYWGWLDHPQNSTVAAQYGKKVEGKVKAVPKKVAKAKGPEKPLAARKNFLFGCDPELFIVDPDGNYVCADMIPGTKENPHGVKFGAVQRDGFAAEINIDPVSTFEDFNRNIKAVLGQLENMLPKGFKLVATPAIRFSPEVFAAAPDEAKELGCSPDWNAWDQQLNPPPKLPDDPFLRCAGGHLHMGWTKEAEKGDVQHMMNCFSLVKQLDWFLGAWSTKHDPDTTRRKMYGNAGACRIKPYGVEYRVLSNFWVLDKALRLQVWNRMQSAINAMATRFYPDKGDGYNKLVISAISEGKLPAQLLRAYPTPINSIEGLPLAA
jgi:hypothetical protein